MSYIYYAERIKKERRKTRKKKRPLVRNIHRRAFWRNPSPMLLHTSCIDRDMKIRLRKMRILTSYFFLTQVSVAWTTFGRRRLTEVMLAEKEGKRWGKIFYKNNWGSLFFLLLLPKHQGKKGGENEKRVSRQTNRGRSLLNDFSLPLFLLLLYFFPMCLAVWLDRLCCVFFFLFKKKLFSRQINYPFLPIRCLPFPPCCLYLIIIHAEGFILIWSEKREKERERKIGDNPIFIKYEFNRNATDAS